MLKIIALHLGRNLLVVILLCLLFITIGYNGLHKRSVGISASSSPSAGARPGSLHLVEAPPVIPVTSEVPHSGPNSRKFQKPKLKMGSEIMDLKHFRFLQNNEKICDTGDMAEPNSLILILVHSARGNFGSRKAIRESWGSTREFGNWKFRTVFLLGIPPSVSPTPSSLYTSSTVELAETASIEKELGTESRTHGDIILGNFVDTYRNMTYKHLMGYKWVLDFCPFAKAVIRADDDMFIDIFKVIHFLTENQNETSSIFCHLMENRPPERNYFDKWAVSRSEYKYDVYPDYCLGAAYITRPNLIEKLFRKSVKFKYFWIDDVFVTGMLRTFVPEIGLEDISDRFTMYETHKTEKRWDKEEWMFGLVPRKLVPIVLKRLWKRTLKNKGIGI